MTRRLASARRVILIGFMGAGKTTVGPLVARRLGWEFVDLDLLIEAHDGRSIAGIFATAGEAEFRRLELQAAARIEGRRDLVIAAGGGAFASEPTRRSLQRDAVAVWLKTSWPTLERRIEGSNRPLARNRDIMARLFAERESSYRMADRIVETDGLAPDEVADRVVASVAVGPWEGEAE